MKLLFVGVGLFLVLTGLAMPGVAGASVDDWAVASSPVVRMPLDALRRAGSASVVFLVPTSDQWMRIRETWGDPGYVVVATSDAPSPSILPWRPLGIAIEASTGRGRLSIEPAGEVGRAVGSSDTGVVFRPRPGDRVRLDLVLDEPDIAAEGEVVVQVNWDADTKGRMVTMLSGVDVRRYARWSMLAGILMLVVAALMPQPNDRPARA